MTDDAGPILLTGATGYIGGRLLRELVHGGHAVRCLVRDPGRLDLSALPGVEAVTGDLLHPETLPAALAGISAAYYLVHSMAAGERGFAGRDLRAARAFGEAARAAGVRRIIYLGGLGNSAGRLSRHLRSRQETGEELRRSGIPVTELRAGVIVGSGSISFEMVRHLTERIPVMICPRWVSTLSQPIAIDDVLRYLVACLDEPRAEGRTIEIGGADVLSWADMIRGYARVRGLRRALIPVPVLTPRLSSLWVDLVTPIPAAFARPLIEGLECEVVVRDPAAREIFPAILPIGYEEAVREAIEKVRTNLVETTWSSSASSAFDRAPEPVRVTVAEGLIVEVREKAVAAPPEAVFRVVEGLGGKRGWLYGNFLWRLRGLLDRLCGGPGMRRGRRHPDELRPGDAVDFWRVEAIERGRRILLGAEMKVPGRAWLELSVGPREMGAGPGTVTPSEYGESGTARLGGPGSARAGRESEARILAKLEACESTGSYVSGMKAKTPDTPGSILRMRAIFEPRGLAGLAYWYSLYPIHRVIFSGMAEAIRQQAEAAEASAGAGAEAPPDDP